MYIGFGRVDGTQVCLDELTNLKRMADIRRVNPDIRLILTTASGENGGFPAGTRTEADIRALAVNLAGAVKAYGFDGPGHRLGIPHGKRRPHRKTPAHSAAESAAGGAG